MLKEIKSIDLVCENCAVITIERKHIGEFWIKDITSNIARIACNSIVRHHACKEFFIELHRDANTEYITNSGISDGTVFDRLMKWSDIASLTITYEDGTEEDCFVPWKDMDNSSFDNRYQSSFVGKCGDLYILVSESRSIDDVIDREYVNDPEMVDFAWRMYSVEPPNSDGECDGSDAGAAKEQEDTGTEHLPKRGEILPFHGLTNTD